MNSHSHHVGAAHRGRLVAATVLVGGFFLVELVAGLLLDSLALLGDAAHMFTDVLGLGMALAAIQLAVAGSAESRRTFGLYRLEILAALANAVLLGGAALVILVEAVGRFADPPPVSGVPLLVVATLGLAVNVVAFALLRRGAAESLNVEGAYLEVLADTLGSIGVVVAAVVITTTGFLLADPIVGVAIGLFVLPRTWRLGRKAVRILVQSAPEHIDVADVRQDLTGLAGVADVHDLHVWTLTSGMDVASAHLRLEHGHDVHAVLDRASTLLRERHGVTHATLQVEPAEHVHCDCHSAW